MRILFKELNRERLFIGMHKLSMILFTLLYNLHNKYFFHFSFLITVLRTLVNNNSFSFFKR